MGNLRSAGVDSGKSTCGGVTTYTRKGKTCRCRSKRPKLSVEERKRFIENQTPEQREMVESFRFMSAFRSAFYNALGRWTPWDAYARGLAQTGLNVFQMHNYSTCDTTGVVNFPAFLFSMGGLTLPVFTLVEREGWTVRLEWKSGLTVGKIRDDDQLLLGYLHESHPDSPQLVWDAGVTRSAGRAEFVLPDYGLDVSDPLHVYPFFGSWNGEEYSRSLYYRLEDGTRFAV